jgi:hypothetical protein
MEYQVVSQQPTEIGMGLRERERDARGTKRDFDSLESEAATSASFAKRERKRARQNWKCRRCKRATLFFDHGLLSHL